MNERTTIWITGASSGIGKACAYEYAKKNSRLILTSSSAHDLETVAEQCRTLGAEVQIMPFDLAEMREISQLVSEVWKIFGKIDIMFCNAGISQRTNIEDTTMEMIDKIMKIDFYAPVAMAKAILPLMLENGGGNIAVTSSITGKFGFPLRCGYSAAKHALYGFFETLQAEYSKKNIKTTIICPGRVKTNISYNAIDKQGKKHGIMDPGQDKGLTADKAARQIVKAIAKGKREKLIGGKELSMVYIKRFFPSLCLKMIQHISPM